MRLNKQKSPLRKAADRMFESPDCWLWSSVFITNALNDACDETITATTVRVWRRAANAPEYDQKEARKRGIEQPVEMTAKTRRHNRTRRNAELMAGWK